MIAAATIHLPLATLSTWHVVALLIVVLLVFGGKRLPELARGLAKSMRIFRDELHSVQNDVTSTLDGPPPTDPSNKKIESKPSDAPAEKPPQS